MKKVTTLLFCLCLFSMMMAQNTSTLIVFSEDGLPFDLILNGVKQNNEHQTNIRVEGLKQPYCNAKILFKEKTLAPIEKKHLMLQDVDGNNAEATYVIKQDKKGRFKLKFYSAIPIETAPPAADDSSVVEYSSTPKTTTTIVTETTTVVEDDRLEDDSDYVDVDVSVGGIEMNVDINVSDDGRGVGMGTDIRIDEEEDMGMNSDIRIDAGGMGMDTDIRIEDNSSSTVKTTTTTTTVVEEAPAPIRSNEVCSDYHMSDFDFGDAKGSIAEKVHEDSKLTLAMQIADANCLTSEQVAEIMKIFSHESTRIEFATHAYKRTFDKRNYYKVHDSFTFESSIDDLNEALGL